MSPTPELTPATELAIRTVLMRYCRGIDRCDAELIRSAYHDDAWEDHGEGYRGNPDGYVAYVLERLPRYVGTQHTLHQSFIELDQTGQEARVETYVVAHHQYVEGDMLMLETLGVRYLDRFAARSPVGWRIAQRVVVLEWRTEQPATPLEVYGRNFATARRDRSDLSFAAELPAIGQDS
ncbi:nuclear transport factor 2 family protein [Actinophytocola sp.]|uniref:nuclear transport factor 2 family protein n=1 Tax=Actinophytocola sp. TaxID=1872138 RepID=UPI003D6B6809